jgi:hypothetical protein
MLQNNLNPNQKNKEKFSFGPLFEKKYQVIFDHPANY